MYLLIYKGRPLKSYRFYVFKYLLAKHNVKTIIRRVYLIESKEALTEIVKLLGSKNCIIYKLAEEVKL